MAERVIHTLEPVYDARSRVLLLGTMPSPKSREAGFFYGHPQNRFWRVLAAVLGRETPGGVPEKRLLLLENRIALWDVLHTCTIEGAQDASIREAQPNDLSPILRAADIRAVFCTGQKAAALYKKHLLPRTGLEAAALPSTSPANCAKSLDQLVEAYRIILTYLDN